MNLFNENQFKFELVKLLARKGIETTPVTAKMRKAPLLTQEIFFDLKRVGTHKPDLIIRTFPDFPCEIKSPAELYGQCRYSHAHLISFLLMVIYGQCLSYADLFRSISSDQMSIYLMVPKIVNTNCPGFDDIEGLFRAILSTAWTLYCKQVKLFSITFSCPSFADLRMSEAYGILGNEIPILTTLITYKPN
jgi:hypothetical protein